jgi:hypothetical protein
MSKEMLGDYVRLRYDGRFNSSAYGTQQRRTFVAAIGALHRLAGLNSPFEI